jgi:hypothetical protein
VPDLKVVGAQAVSVSSSGKITRKKRRSNPLDPLSAAYTAYKAVDDDNKKRARKKKKKRPAAKKRKTKKTKSRATKKRVNKRPKKRANKKTGARIRYDSSIKRYVKDLGVQKILMPKGWKPKSKNAKKKKTKKRPHSHAIRHFTSTKGRRSR